MGVDYGQLVIGPPGSGKTTYCEGMHQLLDGLRRQHLVVNLDFANDWQSKRIIAREISGSKESLPLFDPPDVDVRELVEIHKVMKEQKLGPNGGLLYCVNYLAENLDWLKAKIKEAKRNKKMKHAYILFDMPGQVEVYSHCPATNQIVEELSDKGRNIRLCAVHLVDSTLCTQPHQYLSATLMSLSAQISLEMPFLNILTKIDLLDQRRNRMEFSLEYFARADDLQYLVPMAHPLLSETADAVSDPTKARQFEREIKFARFHEAIVELIEDFNLVSFLPLNIQDKQSVIEILAQCDQANGYSMSAYLPHQLRVPGLDEHTGEIRLPVDLSRRAFGHRWFEDFDSRMPDGGSSTGQGRNQATHKGFVTVDGSTADTGSLSSIEDVEAQYPTFSKVLAATVEELQELSGAMPSAEARTAAGVAAAMAALSPTINEDKRPPGDSCVDGIAENR